jgi:NADPH:quinone reductase-like Zn-dependent oxidoreductase
VCSTTKTELVRSLGADRVIDYTREDFVDGGDRYDMILDTVGRRPLSRLRRALAPRGTLVLVGGEGGGRWFGGISRLLAARLTNPFTRQRLDALIALTRTADLDALRDLIEAGTLRPAVGRTYPLAETSTAVRDLAAGNAPGKLVITVD